MGLEEQDEVLRNFPWDLSVHIVLYPSSDAEVRSYTLPSLPSLQGLAEMWDNYSELFCNEALRESGPRGHRSYCKHLPVTPQNVLPARG